MLETKLFTPFFATEMISCAAMAYAFGCIATDTYSVYNWSTAYSLVYLLRIFDIFLHWLQIDYLKCFELFLLATALMVHLIMQLYLLILYLFIIDCNTINSRGYIGEVIQQVVGIGSNGSRVDTTYPKKSINNLHGYGSDSYMIYGSNTVSIIKTRDKTKREANNPNINGITKLVHSKLFNVLFDSYVILLRILIYDNILPSYAAKEACMNSDSIVINKNINIILQSITDYLHNCLLNLFGLLKRNCINILIVFAGFLNSEVARYPIIIAEYNLVAKKDKNNDRESPIWSLKKSKKLQKGLDNVSQSSKKNKKNCNTMSKITNNDNNREILPKTETTNSSSNQKCKWKR